MTSGLRFCSGTHNIKLILQFREALDTQTHISEQELACSFVCWSFLKFYSLEFERPT